MYKCVFTVRKLKSPKATTTILLGSDEGNTLGGLSCRVQRCFGLLELAELVGGCFLLSGIE